MSLDDGWMQRARCASLQEGELDNFFLERADNTENRRKVAFCKQVCKGCPVRQDCLKFALAHNMRYGIWGGMTTRERRRYFPRAVRLRVAAWWFKAHPGAKPIPPLSAYTPRSRKTTDSEEYPTAV